MSSKNDKKEIKKNDADKHMKKYEKRPAQNEPKRAQNVIQSGPREPKKRPKGGPRSQKTTTI